MKTKVCTKCKIEKDIEEFGVSRQSETGYTSQCRECFNEWQRESLIVPYCKMKEIHVYDDKLNLIGLYHNVVEAVMYHPDLTAVDIYKRCESEKIVNKRLFSFKGYMPYEIQKQLKPFINSLSA